MIRDRFEMKMFKSIMQNEDLLANIPVEDRPEYRAIRYKLKTKLQNMKRANPVVKKYMFQLLKAFVQAKPALELRIIIEKAKTEIKQWQ